MKPEDFYKEMDEIAASFLESSKTKKSAIARWFARLMYRLNRKIVRFMQVED